VRRLAKNVQMIGLCQVRREQPDSGQMDGAVFE
jgi:hypothetical protein